MNTESRTMLVGQLIPLNDNSSTKVEQYFTWKIWTEKAILHSIVEIAIDWRTLNRISVIADKRQSRDKNLLSTSVLL